MNPDANVFLRNLLIKSKKEFEQYLSENFGPILSVIIKTNPKTGDSLEYGYAQFEKVEDALKCVEALNGKDLWGGVLDVSIFKAQKDRDYKKTNLFITGFPSNCEEKMVQDFIKNELETCGKIINKIINKKDSTLSTCVNFESEESAKKALEKYNNFVLDGNTLVVQYYMSKREMAQKFEKQVGDVN